MQIVWVESSVGKGSGQKTTAFCLWSHLLGGLLYSSAPDGNSGLFPLPIGHPPLSMMKESMTFLVFLGLRTLEANIQQLV